MNDNQGEDQPQPKQPGVEGWDRIGDFMGRANETGQSIARRHLDVWNELSSNLREPKYGADDWARNSARVAASMIDDVQDVLGLLTTAPDRRPVAGGIPTVFLFIEVDEEGGEGEDTLPDVQWITAPRSIRSPPPRARIALSGGPEHGAAWAVRESISVQRDDEDKSKYRVVYTRPDPKKDPLKIGSYFGLIYLRGDRSEVPLADLRVVVRPRSDD